MLSLWNDVPMPSLIDRVFDDVMRSAFGTHGTALSKETFQPAVDVRSDDDKLVFECDVPGMKQEDIEITVDNRVLTIKGTRKLESASEKQHVVLGRAYGAFSCSYTLPEWVDADRMTADLANGVLTISIPKQPQAKPRRILIGGGAANKQLGQ